MTILAPNVLNTVNPSQVLPLGHSSSDVTRFSGKRGSHVIFIPSDLGGQLAVGLDTAPYNNVVRLVVLDPVGRIHDMASPNQPVVIDIEPGERGHGRFTVGVDAPEGRYNLWAVFSDFGVAREKDKTPLIPWNFWYFPFQADPHDRNAWRGSKLRPLQKYERAFDNPGAYQWEIDNHSDLYVPRKDWDGHCHDIAPASVIFKPPPVDGRRHGRIHFTCEELKLLAGEALGGVKRSDVKYWLEHDSAPEGEPPDPALVTQGYFHWNKPSADPAKFGNEARALRAILTMLREQMREEGHPLIMDFRDSGGDEHDAIWNQAAFEYSTTLAQKDPSDLTLVEGRTVIYANRDRMDADASPSGMPAEPIIVQVGGAKKGTRKLDALERRLKYQLRFAPDGQEDWTATSDIRWERVDGYEGGRLFPDLHAPRYAAVLLPPRNDGTLSPQKDKAEPNPLVFWEDVLQLLPRRELYA